MASSQNRNTAYTPVAQAHQPKFQCLQCTHCCYSRAGLKNHVHAMHRSQATSPSDRASHTSSPVSASEQLSDSESYPQHSDNEEEHPMDVDLDVQLPLAFPDAYHNDENDGYGYNNDLEMDLHDYNLHDNDGPSSNLESSPIIPSSLQHEFESQPHEHQQIPANDRFLRRVYHDKLNGELIMHFSHFKISISYVLIILFRSEM